MHKPDWPRDISARFSSLNAESYLVYSIQPLVKIGFDHDILYCACQIWVFVCCSTSDCKRVRYYYWKGSLHSGLPLQPVASENRSVL